MAKIIPTDTEVAKKWSDVTPGRKEYYLGGVGKVTDWASPTIKAEGRYESGVSDAIGRKAFGKGVAKAGTVGWKEPTLKKGAIRWGPGVRDAGPKYQKKFSPFMSTIRALHGTLPARYPKGSPENLKRVEHMAMGLRAKKLELLGG